MRRAFALTLLLIAVIAAIAVLRQRAERAHSGAPLAPQGSMPDAGVARATPNDVGAHSGAGRVVALSRLLPRYAIDVPAAEPAPVRDTVLRALLSRGGVAADPLPADPRVSFVARIPHAAFKRLVRDLRGIAPGLRIRGAGERPHVGGPAVIELELRVGAP